MIGRKMMTIEDFERSSRFGLIFCIAMCMFVLFSIVGIAPAQHLERYTGMLLIMMLIRMICGVFMKGDSKSSCSCYTIACRAVMMVMMAFGVMESIGDPSVVATAILPLYVVCGVMFADTMLNFTLICVTAQAFLSWSSMMLKSEELAYGDLLNGFTFLIVAIAVHYVVQRERIAHFLTVYEVRKLRKETLMRATFDKLSGVLNRGTFSEIFDKIIKGEHGPMAVFLMDLDDFKGINDTYGHERGDYAIEKLGRTLLESIEAPAYDEENIVGSILNSQGNLAGRFGGDEFIVIIRKDVNEANVRLLLERILANVRKIRVIRENSLTVTIGALMVSEDQHDNMAVMVEVDKALYEAKHAGKDRYVLRGAGEQNR